VSGVWLALACGAGLTASALATAQTMSRNDYLTETGQIVLAHRAARADCAAQGDVAGALCRTEATNAANIASAELDARYKPSASAERQVQRVRVDAAYATARERCNAETEVSKPTCVRRAQNRQAAAYAALERHGAAPGGH